MIFIVRCTSFQSIYAKLSFQQCIACNKSSVDDYRVQLFSPFLLHLFCICIISRFHYSKKLPPMWRHYISISFLLSSIKWSTMGLFKMRTISQHQKLNWNTHSFYVYKNWTPIYIQIVVNEFFCFPFLCEMSTHFNKQPLAALYTSQNWFLLSMVYFVCFMVWEKEKTKTTDQTKLKSMFSLSRFAINYLN